jgi:hypothetical protein
VNLAEEIETLLAWWLPRVLDVIEPTPRCVVIGGSVALGDFSPVSGDLDLYIVVRDPLSEVQSTTVGCIHREMRKHFLEDSTDEWRSHELMEACYIPEELATNATKPMRYFSVRTSSAMWVDQKLSPFSRYVVARSGLYYYGERVQFAEPERRDMLEQIVRQTIPWVVPAERRLDDPEWMASQIQLMARSIVFLRDGFVLSKTAALRHEIDAKSRFAAAYETALLFRQRGLTWAQGQLGRIREDFESIRKDAAQSVREHCASEGVFVAPA